MATTSRHSCRQTGSPPRTGRSSAEQRRLTSAGSGVRTLKPTESGTAEPGLGRAVAASPPEVDLDRVPGEPLDPDLDARRPAPVRCGPSRSEASGNRNDLPGDLDRQLRPERGLDPGPDPPLGPRARPTTTRRAGPGTAGPAGQAGRPRRSGPRRSRARPAGTARRPARRRQGGQRRGPTSRPRRSSGRRARGPPGAVGRRGPGEGRQERRAPRPI